MTVSLVVGAVAVVAFFFTVPNGQPGSDGFGVTGGIVAENSPDPVRAQKEQEGPPDSSLTAEGQPVDPPDSSQTAEEEPVDPPDSFQLAEDALRQAAEAHTKAFQAGDLDGYLKIFDHGNAGLLRKQTNTFNNLRKLPLGKAAFEVQDGKGLTKDSFGNWITFSFEVTLEHQFEGIDLRPVDEWYRWTVVKADENAPPTVTKVAGITGTYAGSYPAPWDSWADMSAVTTEHTVVLTHSDQADLGARVAPLAEEAAVADLDFWARNGDPGTPVPARFMIVLAKRRDEQGHLFRHETPKFYEAGVSISMPSSSAADGYFGGSRIVVDSTPWHFGDADEGVDAVREIFRHEIAHSLLAPLASEAFAESGEKWVIEGFAEYIEHHGQSLGDNGRTPETRAYVRGEGDRPFEGRIPDNDSWELNGLVGENYQLSGLAIQMIAERYGERKAVEFVLAHYRGAGSDQALTEVLGIGRQDFERQWAEYVRAAFA
ncbi:hypothetical protein [Sphaerisporangium sp. NPDC051011]|uniref:hypothetical protein n=1 Tax=Sphaerisporangium sp. NPDC051011 TaxID=3155792 RepID=UPI0033C5663E